MKWGRCFNKSESRKAARDSEIAPAQRHLNTQTPTALRNRYTGRAAATKNVSENIWIIIPVHNRRETTRACLSNLRALGELEKYQVCVVDDASSDGTAEMLAAEYPEIKVIQGTGHLYWGGGIATGMMAAQAASADVHVWLNDDCLPDENSIACVVERARTTRGMCGGICRDSEDPTLVTYSGSKY